MTRLRRVRLEVLLEGIAASLPDEAGRIVVSGLAYDSRAVRAGDLFFCLPGEKTDGHRFAEAACRAGAAAVVAERSLSLPPGAQLVRVPSTRLALARAADRFYGSPSRALRPVGVTGTNGKTTVSYLARSIFEADGQPTGILGTVEHRWMEERRPAGNTTPQSLEVQEMLRAMLDAGCKRAVMEVSSHGLALDRVADIEFGAAVFTNLSRDHLDFHGSLAAYREVKASFFRRSGPYGESRVAVVNLDDPVGREIVAATELDRVTFGVEEEADVRARLLRADLAGTRVRLQIGREARETTLQLVGRFNASNAAAAAGAAHALGVGIDRIAEGLASLPAVPGRMETVRAGQPFTVIVDYAHTPDALERLLTAVREMARGPVTLVFGCGGDRDRGKRPIMGGVAARLAERVIVTNDNPRSEDPQEIVDAILAGMSDREIDGGARGARHAPEVTLDRAEAIDLAVRECGDDGVVVVAGKGHEDYQIVGGERRAFDDRDAVRGSLRALGHSGGGKSGK